ncbi:hypothetical protein [Granulicella tundricola]|uniref:Uncharacterized protein n=1 Tax=Granulicella tundricola (strain ATCC BAA-1859 / DSM 23138 / MP5ACTX9) TaxID=1198114 RepID=E8X3W3_GRATM|nr:hypothetical protein [Granulicella tundricola]ADW70471.1 hypothetical protein AciX9_3466 [Granulicella tundricola MP5ACTX9]
MHKTYSTHARTEELSPSRSNKIRGISAAVAVLACGLLPAVSFAQAEAQPASLQLVSSSSAAEGTLTATAEPLEVEPVKSDTTALPDAPSFSSSKAPADGEEGTGGFGGQPRAAKPHEAGHLDKIIQPGEIAPRLTVGDKILIGLRANATYTYMAGWVVSAAYEQVVNGAPNYGQTGKGFAQRLGAAAARSASDNIFSDSVLAPILHEDPRYYRLGPGHNFVARFFYAGTRELITRSDSGARTINFADIGGNLGGAALTQWYYPPLNRNVSQVMQTWGSSLGGDAVRNVANEFFPRGILHFGHSN